ncbi:hypothetical protein, partial [Escherichia coli]|uniref:hypothetical protein n=1 Tax=Escherichia coli TaxID=562 RepID=UPI003B9F9AC0
REYDELGRLIQETAPDGDITRYRYDNPHSDLPCATEDATGSRGQLIAVKDTQGHETRYEYNIAGDLTAVIAPDGSRNGTQY